MKNYT